MRVIRSRSPVVLFFAHQLWRARAMPCAKWRQDKILFFAAQRFFLEKKSERRDPTPAADRKNFSECGPPPSARGSDLSDLVILDARRLASVLCDVDHEVREEALGFTLQQTKRGDREPSNLHLGAFAGT